MVILKILSWASIIIGIFAMTIWTSDFLFYGGDISLVLTSFLLLVLPAIIFLKWRHKVEAPMKNFIKNKKNQKLPNHKDNKTIFLFTGFFNFSPVIVTIDGNWLTIERSGLTNALTHGFDGIKKMNMKNITAVQLKEGGITSGYIQLVLLGSQENKGGLIDAMRDENTITFRGKHNINANKLVNIIEDKIDELQNESYSDTQIIQTESIAKQLKDLNEILNLGILTQEEFDKQKQIILNT